MKHYTSLLIFFFAAVKINAQQVSNPATNVPEDYIPQSHSFQYPFSSYSLDILPVYIREWDMEIPINSGMEQTLNSSNARIKTTYVDGLGRPIQTVRKQATDNSEDLIKMMVYDNLGRTKYEILPYARPSIYSNGKLDINPVDGLNSTHNSSGSIEQQEPFFKNEIEGSPLNRLLVKYAPGENWVGSNRGVTYGYNANIQWVNVLPQQTINGGYPRWTIGGANSDIPVCVGEYGLNELSISSRRDEDGNYSDEVKDKFGRIVFTRKKTNAFTLLASYPTEYAYTFYVYDDFGRLRCVIPPKAYTLTASGTNYSWSLNLDQTNNLCYQYYYDGKGRLIEKKIPGKEREYIVYNKWNNVALSQDGNQRTSNQWQFSIYDARDKVIMTGLFTSNLSRLDLQNILDDETTYQSPPTLFYYLKFAGILQQYPTSIPDCNILTKTFYSDNDISTELPTSTFINSVYPQGGMANHLKAFRNSSRIDGLIVGSKIKILDPDNPTGDNWIKTKNYYNSDGQLVQVHNWNHKNGVDVISYQHTFRGDLWAKTTAHNNPSAVLIPGAAPFFPANYMQQIKVANIFQRNLASNGNIWRYQQSINGGPAFNIADYEYTPQGNISIKNYSGANVYYHYDIHNKPTFIGAYLMDPMSVTISFLEDIYYDKGFASKLYNGNIAGITWRSYGSSAPQRFYGYSYDRLDRLTHAEFGERLGTTAYSKNVTDYTVSNITYDLNGNILTMDQRGVGGASMTPLNMDKLTYSYKPNSNQLIKVEDAGDNNTTLPDFKNLANVATEYTYDNNGNMVTDGNKNIGAITYNYMNLPATISIPGKGTVKFVYDALGNKLQKKVIDDVQQTQTVFDYIGGFNYKNNILQHFVTDEGRCRPYLTLGQSSYGYTTPTAINYNYDYFIKDHLGNVRQTITTETMIRNYLAEHELGSANIEQLVFDNIELVRDSKPGSTNPEDMMAAELIADDPQKRVGTSIFLRVMPGDKFEISADSYYEGEPDPGGSIPADDLIASLVGALTGGVTYSGVPVSEIPENQQIIEQTLNGPDVSSTYDALFTGNESVQAPKAFLNYLFFDDKMNLLPEKSGRVQVSAGAEGWHTIAPSEPLKAEQPGYVAVFVGNLNLGTTVWFDKVTIKQTQGRVTDENHYYPFGLTLNQASGVEAEKNYIKYNSKELQRDEFTAANGNKSGLEMYDYGARMMDPQLGRWMNVDPLAEVMRRYSPYNFAFDNPVRFIDPDGMSPTDYYNLKGNFVKHEPDGKDDKKLVLTESKKESKVDEAIAKGEVASVPSSDVISKMDEAYQKTEETGNEHGFVVATDGTTSSLKTSNDEGSVKLATNYEELQDGGKTSSYDVHTHPNVKDGNGNVVEFGAPQPSGEPGAKGGDIYSYGKDGPNNSPSVVLGYEQSRSTNTNLNSGFSQSTAAPVPVRTIGFYNSNGPVGQSINYNSFKNAVEKINNQ